MTNEPETQPIPTMARPINCDQVAWLLDVFDRYLSKAHRVGISKEREMQLFGMLYEVMEIANLQFADAGARHNGTPYYVRPVKGECYNEPMRENPGKPIVKRILE